MDWLPFFIGGGVCLFCLCIVIIALIVRYRSRRDRGERLQETGLQGTNMYDMDVGDDRESVKVDYLEPDSTHELLPPLDMAPPEEPITEVHIEWVESERESERLPGYSALPAAASLRNGGL